MAMSFEERALRMVTRGRLRVTKERWVDLIEFAMMVSVSLMGVGQLSFD
jgi:hypothetical protein